MAIDDDVGWEPVDGVEPALDVVELDDLDLLGEITHPTRSLILRQMEVPRTVADVAGELSVPITRLYHHVNKLEQLGLIRVVATRQVAAVTERRYQVVGRSFRVSPALLRSADQHELAAAFGSMFDVTKLSLQRFVATGGAQDFTGHNAFLTLSEFRLSPERRRALIERTRELIDEFGAGDDDGDDAEPVTFFGAVFRDPG